MAEPPADHIQRDAGLREERRHRVPEGVRRDLTPDGRHRVGLRPVR